MNMIDRMEQSRFGRFGIPNLMRYVIMVNALGLLIDLVRPDIYYYYLSLDIYAILHGQVWRLVTFLLCPTAFGSSGIGNLLWFAIWAWCYYSIGMNLERMWGTFRFNLFYFSGVLGTVLITFVFYLCTMTGNDMTDIAYSLQLSQVTSLSYLNETLFLAFALMFPDVQFLIYFVIPVKAKWLSIFYFGLTGYEIINAILLGRQYVVGYCIAAQIVISLINLGVFFLLAKGKAGPRQAMRQKKRRQEFQYKANSQGRGPRHHCVICGRTDVDAPDLEFRYCSKCEGNYEYCSEHLFTHEHVRHD